ncbi:MAG: helix-turn-helix domain-containing protein [Treponema sp.]|nr:helix-turn-helix domain-containing protein [Treponema sp.]
MNRNYTTTTASTQDKTGVILRDAQALMAVYTRATGAFACVYDHNYTPMPGISLETGGEKNACSLCANSFCTKGKKNVNVNNRPGAYASPCGKIHTSAIKESHRLGGSYTYECPLGFMFWTSPLYFNGQFAGALCGGGFLGVDSEEACARIHTIYGEAVSEGELKQTLSHFPCGEGQKVKALAELMLVCAKSLSAGSDGCHAAAERRTEQQAELSARIEVLKNQYPLASHRPEYPLDKERELLDALRRADTGAARYILNEILAAVFLANPDQFKHIQYRAMELAVLISRTDTGCGFSAQTVLETNSQYINSIREADTIEELTDAMHQIFDGIAGQIFSFQGMLHASALKKAERFILDNFTRRISLEEIARVSGFSAPYFSTIFREEMGENLSSYLNRLRVEKAGYMLTSTNFSLSKIARACGFEDQSWFSKIFKLYTGANPGKYRSQGGKSDSGIPEIRFSASLGG